ncbi:efflux RND transporter periplasmic adaptor subunit [Congregibacter litoralis]|uniref:RND family efflux transporter, MFP subunit n=1 Tax=Congregibacter litoralis KT71 TaxID=314285 RepID=A4A4Y2_9GAMM|nr:efflux RND transporter periplasmic adaptor subunit [Congregibacter litoralis]EAQ98853.1 RND family efflux transporter, MFP subunit [Congregibacter litoralis KT71]
MNAKRTILFSLGALAGLLLLIGLMAGIFRDRTEPGVLAQSPIDDGDSYTVALRDVPAVESIAASVEARETTIIASRLLARVEQITMRAGDYAQAGQLLVTLENEDLEAQVAQTSEAMKSVEARLIEARQNRDRAVELHERKLIADADLDAANANAAALTAELAAAKQSLEIAKTSLSFAEIRSPIAGRIVDRFVEPGDTVSPGQSILSLYNPVSLRIEAWVRESLALSLKEGQEVAVEIPALNSRLTARIEELVPAADPGSRAFKIKATLPAAPGLLPGMYARMLVAGSPQHVVVVPLDRIAEVGQLNIAWVNSDAGPARRFLRLGERVDDEHIIVTAGLAPGDELLMPPG